jgi:hypothetical protein
MMKGGEDLKESFASNILFISALLLQILDPLMSGMGINFLILSPATGEPPHCWFKPSIASASASKAKRPSISCRIRCLMSLTKRLRSSLSKVLPSPAAAAIGAGNCVIQGGGGDTIKGGRAGDPGIKEDT